MAKHELPPIMPVEVAAAPAPVPAHRLPAGTVAGGGLGGPLGRGLGLCGSGARCSGHGRHGVGSSLV